MGGCGEVWCSGQRGRGRDVAFTCISLQRQRGAAPHPQLSFSVSCFLSSLRLWGSPVTLGPSCILTQASPKSGLHCSLPLVPAPPRPSALLLCRKGAPSFICFLTASSGHSRNEGAGSLEPSASVAALPARLFPSSAQNVGTELQGREEEEALL